MIVFFFFFFFSSSRRIPVLSVCVALIVAGFGERHQSFEWSRYLDTAIQPSAKYGIDRAGYDGTQLISVLICPSCQATMECMLVYSQDFAGKSDVYFCRSLGTFRVRGSVSWAEMRQG